ncbi:hypothetical protein HDU97_008559 [Phlyctochytrium planicorne]|nr:hypothetical protein HDU97_008559 [Phlyctochytrium planicorne]
MYLFFNGTLGLTLGGLILVLDAVPQSLHLNPKRYGFHVVLGPIMSLLGLFIGLARMLVGSTEMLTLNKFFSAVEIWIFCALFFFGVINIGLGLELYRKEVRRDFNHISYLELFYAVWAMGLILIIIVCSKIHERLFEKISALVAPPPEIGPQPAVSIKFQEDDPKFASKQQHQHQIQQHQYQSLQIQKRGILDPKDSITPFSGAGEKTILKTGNASDEFPFRRSQISRPRTSFQDNVENFPMPLPSGAYSHLKAGHPSSRSAEFEGPVTNRHVHVYTSDSLGQHARSCSTPPSAGSSNAPSPILSLGRLPKGKGLALTSASSTRVSISTRTDVANSRSSTTKTENLGPN